MITLFHGSNVVINEIDLSLTKKGKDFGQGFYLNADKDQALSMAKRTVLRSGTGNPVVNEYEFDDSILSTPGNLKVKIFDDYSVEWADFILLNRNHRSDGNAHPYDIVVGPIADDTVGVQLGRFISGYISMDKLIEELKYRGNHAVQYYFGTNEAVKCLKKLRYE